MSIAKLFAFTAEKGMELHTILRNQPACESGILRLHVSIFLSHDRIRTHVIMKQVTPAIFRAARFPRRIIIYIITSLYYNSFLTLKSLFKQLIILFKRF